MTNRAIEFPERLLHDDSIAGRLLRRSLDELPAFPNEARCYDGLLARRQLKREPMRYWLRLAVTAGLATAVGVVWFARRDADAVRFTVRADRSVTTTALGTTASPLEVTEPKRAFVAAPATSSKPASRVRGETAAPFLEQPPRLGIPQKAEARVDDSSASGAENPQAPEQQVDSSEGTVNAPAASTPVGALNDDVAVCAGLARIGKLEAAASCYDRIGRGNGMTSELALYEKARLESRALGRGAAALATLEEHARRFPQGALAVEAGLTRIELLSRLGRTSEALNAIERALPGAIGRERGGDLYLLRGDLLSLRGECAGARAAYAAARVAGIHPNRLKAGEERCARAAEATRPDAAESTSNE